MNTPQDFDDFATHIHSDEMIPVNYNETNTYLTPDQLISELRTEIKHLNRDYELLERTAIDALDIVIEQIERALNREYELCERMRLDVGQARAARSRAAATDALASVVEQIETHKVRYKHDSSTSAMEAPRHSGRTAEILHQVGDLAESYNLLPGKES